MRENMGLFLGKRETDGKWVEGYLYPGIGQHKGKWFITVVDDCLTTSHTYAVIPETIREFTGLSDKTGKGIFEGDIVKIGGCKYYHKVEYLFAQFFVGINMPIAYARFDCEIVGNVFDNPELLNKEI